MAKKGQKLKSYPEELKAEALRRYLEEYILLVEDWLIFYNTSKIKFFELPF